MSRARLHLVVEGQTEEAFVKRVLVPHLTHHQVFADVRVVATRKGGGRRHKGGGRKYSQWRKDIVTWMKEDDNRDSWFTTMFDVHGLRELRDGFPGLDTYASGATSSGRATVLEEAFAADIGRPRFIPHLQLHEFEALLFCNPDRFLLQFPGSAAQVANLHGIAADFGSPEDIDDGTDTAPSKRIAAEIPEYDGRKVSAGPVIAEAIGLDAMKQNCPHFRDWVTKLEQLG